MSTTRNNDRQEKNISQHVASEDKNVAQQKALTTAAESRPENAKEMLWHGIHGILRHAVSMDLELLIAEVGDVEQMLSLHIEQSQGQIDVFQAIERSVNKRISQVGGRMAALENAVSASSDRTIAQLKPVFIETRDAHRGAAESFNDFVDAFSNEVQSVKESCRSELEKLHATTATALTCTERYREAAILRLDRLEKRADTIVDAIDGLIAAVGNLRGEVEAFAVRKGRVRWLSRDNISMDCFRKRWTNNGSNWSVIQGFVRRFVRRRFGAPSRKSEETTGPADV